MPFPNFIRKMLAEDRRICTNCRGIGRVNHICSWVCVDDPCPNCSGTGWLTPAPAPEAADEKGT